MAKNKKEKTPKKKIEKRFEISEEIRDIAVKIFTEEKMDIHPARIEYVLVYPYISKKLAGKCIKAGGELKFFGDLDYLIEMSGELWDSLNDKQKYILTLHELKHVLITNNENTGDVQFKIRTHDVQDFKSIISKYGIDWIGELKSINSSLYDLNPEEEDSFSI